ncbi:MAG: hypothetical protein K5851_05065 [Lachnospiraceae bacterium]|nr:hypothetical protein [Lachnospiraceae bacterium]
MYLTVLFLGLIVYITFRLSKLRRTEHDEAESFWAREQNANFTPKKDISNLSYITIPMEKFPSDNIDKEEERLYLELRELSEKRILNLDSMSNTDLKENFGMPNLNLMEEIGDNYQKMCSLLISLAEKRISQGDYEGALRYLEFGVGTKSDMSKLYILLGECYAKLGKESKIADITTLVRTMNLPLEKSIIESLTSHLPNVETDIHETADNSDTEDV